LSFKLWGAALLLVVVYSAVGALATLLLPFEIVNGRTQVPPPTSPGEAASRLIIGLGLYLPTLAFSLFVLGGVLGVAQDLPAKGTLSAGGFLDQAKQRFLPILRWGFATMGVALAAGMAAAFFFSFLWAVMGRSPAMKYLVTTAFWGAMLAAGLLMVYSPVILIDQRRGVLDSFKESSRFFNANRTATFGLILWVSFIGAMIWLVWAISVAPVVGKIRTMMGIAPFAKGLPVFFFSLINGLPSAYLSVFVPLAIALFYWGRTGKISTQGVS